MGEKVFMQGNQALAESAIRAGCHLYFGYPITPSSEIAEYFAAAVPRGVTFVQAETEVAAFNMLAGSAAAGKRVMTATSGPGFSLGCEALSYMAAAGLPAVIVNVMRPGPADGEILASQGDYFQVTKGGGHGDYRTIVLAPWSVQEEADFIQQSFLLAEKYVAPVVLLSDATLAKMRESLELPAELPIPEKTWDAALTGADGEQVHQITTCGDGPAQWEAFNLHLQDRFTAIRDNEQRWESTMVEDADVVFVAFGSVARIALDAMRMAREAGLKVGLIRPITLWPFPEKAFAATAGKQFFVCELNAGQMVEDVKLAVDDKNAVQYYGRFGGYSPTPRELFEQLKARFYQEGGKC